MLAFAVIAGKSGAPVDPDIVAFVGRESSSILHFQPDQETRWSNAGGSIHVLAWQAFTEIARIRSHWLLTPNHFTACSGHAWPRPSGWSSPSNPWAAQLARYLRDHDILEVQEHLYGTYTIVDIPAEGAGHIVTDLLGIGMLFHGETGDAMVYSNRAGIAAKAIAPIDQEPERDLYGAGWLVFWGSTMGGDSGYSGVKRLPADSYVKLDARQGPRIERRKTSFWQFPDGAQLPSTHGELQRLLYVDLASSLHSIAAVPGTTREIRLSGGKDSRLLAAIVLNEQLQDRFSFLTYGLPHSPEVVAAQQVAQACNLNWSFDDRSHRDPATGPDKLRVHAFQVEAGTNAWDLASDLMPDDRIVITGNFGEFVRIAATSIDALSAKSADEVIDLVRNKAEYDGARLLRLEAKQHYQQIAAEWARAHIDRGSDFRRVGSFLLPNFRAPAWVGPTRAAKSAIWTMPYVTPMVFRIGQALPTEQRATQRFHFDLLTQLNPTLAVLPLAGDTWPEVLYRNRDDAGLFRKIQPILADPSAATGWHELLFQANREFFADVLMDRTNPIFDVLDINRVERLLGRERLSGGLLRNLYAALTGAIWMGHRELRMQIHRLVTTEVPMARLTTQRAVRKPASLRLGPRTAATPR